MTATTVLARYFRSKPSSCGACLAFVVLAMHITVIAVIMATVFTYSPDSHRLVADERTYKVLVAALAMMALMMCTRELLTWMAYDMRTVVLVLVLGIHMLFTLVLTTSESIEALWLGLVVGVTVSFLTTVWFT